ncbi:hypothetical protein [Nostoc sp. ChiQUE01b]|uniref:hypothetical protein n=1 Tax=Nostoc sp. ChiQUE01b TaxID=3075376 RepID=UPI002AD39F64|nr:hypothetical protein [Nostoc sp. ChiQUE01b]MDZ8257526.1 hypothetical protein [Nostoc sp. ChiQUE01b]
MITEADSSALVLEALNDSQLPECYRWSGRFCTTYGYSCDRVSPFPTGRCT